MSILIKLLLFSIATPILFFNTLFGVVNAQSICDTACGATCGYSGLNCPWQEFEACCLGWPPHSGGCASLLQWIGVVSYFSINPVATRCVESFAYKDCGNNSGVGVYTHETHWGAQAGVDNFGNPIYCDCVQGGGGQCPAPGEGGGICGPKPPEMTCEGNPCLLIDSAYCGSDNNWHCQQRGVGENCDTSPCSSGNTCDANGVCSGGTPVSACINGDSCCGTSCDYTTDTDCPTICRVRNVKCPSQVKIGNNFKISYEFFGTPLPKTYEARSIYGPKFSITNGLETGKRLWCSTNDGFQDFNSTWHSETKLLSMPTQAQINQSYFFDVFCGGVVLGDNSCSYDTWNSCMVKAVDTNPIFESRGFIKVMTNTGVVKLNLIDIDDAFTAGNGIIKVQTATGTLAADLVDIGDPDASAVRVKSRVSLEDSLNVSRWPLMQLDLIKVWRKAP